MIETKLTHGAKKILIKDFRRFLYKNGVIVNKFLLKAGKDYTSYLWKTPTYYRASIWIHKAFIWAETGEGGQFWAKIHRKWYCYCMKLRDEKMSN